MFTLIYCVMLFFYSGHTITHPLTISALTDVRFLHCTHDSATKNKTNKWSNKHYGPGRNLNKNNERQQLIVTLKKSFQIQSKKVKYSFLKSFLKQQFRLLTNLT